MPRVVLFLCTGNYYRSRYAEVVFNHLARQAGLDWVARSRALEVNKGGRNVGPISAHARDALARDGIPLPDPLTFPQQVCEADLAAADRVIALKEAEHRPYLARMHPAWVDRVHFWHVHDLDQSLPGPALAEVADRVAALVESLAERR